MSADADTKTMSLVPEVVGKDDAIDEKLVDEAARVVNAKLQATVMRGLMEVGSYLFETFFDGDLNKVSAKGTIKSASFEKLAERCGTTEIPVSKTWLHKALWVAVVGKRLGGQSAFMQLPSSYQVEVLPLRHKDEDFKAVEKVAKKAVDKGLKVRALRDLVEKEAPERTKKRGKPFIAATLDRVFAKKMGKKLFTVAEAKELSPEQARDAILQARALFECFDDILPKLVEKALEVSPDIEKDGKALGKDVKALLPKLKEKK